MKIAYIKTNLEAHGYVIHGLGILSSIGQAAGHESLWVNACCPPCSMPDWFSQYRPDAVAITCCSDAFPAVRDIAHAAKQVDPKMQVWIGGPHATFAPKDFWESVPFDYLVQGEGEVIWQEFCQGKLPDSPQVQGSSPADLDLLPFADRHQEIDYATISESPPLPLHAFPGPYRCVLAGRGCRFNCAFCKPGTDQIFGKGSRRRSAQRVLEELRGLAPFGSLFIHDDNLLEDEAWCREFIAGWDGRPFLIQGRADLMVRHEALLEEMVKGGLRCMLIGFESGSDKVLKAMRKGTTRAINEKAAAIGHRLNISMQANMIFGTPGETKEDVLASIDLINHHLKPCTNSLCVYTPYPGSDWGQSCTENRWNLVAGTYEYGRGIGGRKLNEAAFDYSYDWLYEALKRV